MLLCVVGVLLLALTVAVAAHSATEVCWAASNAMDAIHGIHMMASMTLEAAHTNAPLATATVALCLLVSACFGRVNSAYTVVMFACNQMM